MTHIPAQTGPGEVDRALAQPAASQPRVVDMRAVVEDYSEAYTPVLAQEAVVLNSVQTVVRIVVAKHKTQDDEDYRYMPLAQALVPDNKMPVI